MLIQQKAQFLLITFCVQWCQECNVMISRIQWYYIVVQCFYTVISLETKTKMRFHSLLTEDKQSTSITVTQSKSIRVYYSNILKNI